MKKLKRFSLRSVQVLSEAEMEKIDGGDFTIYDCREDTVGEYCALSFGEGNTITLGVCGYTVETKADGFHYTYQCDKQK